MRRKPTEKELEQRARLAERLKDRPRLPYWKIDDYGTPHLDERSDSEL